MVDRVSAAITVGGTLPICLLDRFEEIVQSEALSTDWDGETFCRTEIRADQSLRLVAHEVSWGRFDMLEAFCRENGLAFARWSGGYAGQWGPERVVFTGAGEPATYAATEDDEIMIDRATVDRLATLAKVGGYFDAADFTIPPLIVSPEAP